MGCTNSNSYYKIEGFAQGGQYNIIYSDININGKQIPYSTDEIREDIDSIIRRIDNSLSGYNPTSTLTKINNNETTAVDSLFLDLFNVSKEVWLETEGKFDISAAPLFDFWGFGFTQGNSYPEEIIQSKIDSILQFIGMDKVRIEDMTIIKDDPRIKLNFNAIAQGYTCDLVAQSLQERGIINYLIEIGGEIICKGKNTNGDNWRIGIDSPEDGNMVSGKKINNVIEITDAALVTSGNYRKYYIKNGEKFSHTIDPKTGYPVTHNLLSTTIITQSATMADAYATFCMVQGLKSSIEWLESNPDIEGYLIYGNNDTMSTYFSNTLKNKIKQ